jgi:hypothetical protein
MGSAGGVGSVFQAALSVVVDGPSATIKAQMTAAVAAMSTVQLR